MPRDVEFKASADGSTQHYVEMLPKDFAAGDVRHLMMAFHGHGSDRWQYVKDARDECRGARDVALRHGMIFVSPDYRASTSWMGPKAEADVVQIIAELRARYKIGKVVHVGGSMGGTGVLTFAALHPDLVDAVCSNNGTANHEEFAGFQDAIAASFGGSKKDKPDEYRKRSAEFFPEKFTMPVGITAGGKDAVVPPQSVLRLAEAIKKTNNNVKLIYREDGGHATDYKDTVAALEFVVLAAGVTGGETVAQRSASEGSMTAAEVKAGAVVYRHKAAQPETVTGFYVRLANCIGPTREPAVVALRAGGELRPERVAIPVYGTPLNMYTRQNGRVFPPLDVAQEYRVALLKPLTINPGDDVLLEVVSAEKMASGVTAGLQFAGTWPLLAMREPFRQTKGAGPISRVAWSEREVICTGNQKKFDPQCAPQNNSVIVADADGTLFQFTAFYSVDEQYGGGRGGSYARTYGYRKGPGAKAWEPLGLALELPKGMTYAADPFAFRDLDGTPCLVLGVVDGTNGFSDWRFSWGYLLRSTTRSFAGPWGEPHFLWEKFPRGNADSERMICIRLFPREKTRDYVMCWQHGGTDISVRGAILPGLKTTLTHEQIRNAPVLVRNQDEGSGGFVRGDKGYICSWQIPNVNDVTSIQRLCEFDLYDALNPEKWRVAPGSWGFNDGTNTVEDGGATADCWSLSLAGGRLWATSVVWSVTNRKNSVLACSVPWDNRLGDAFRYGVSRVGGYNEVAPVVEYAVGEKCSLSAEITGFGQEAYAFLFLAPSARPLFWGGVAVEVSDKGARLVAYSDKGQPAGLTPYQEPKYVPGRAFKVRLRRDGDTIAGWVDGVAIGAVTIADPAQKRLLDEPQRFKFYGWQGGLYTVKDAVLVDGP
ncbi:MAG: alpha/beta fold hydrolase [Planctomycetota bacterium]|nr:alpha/beta fold hydrolase [Planctomycetota bacterium]